MAETKTGCPWRGLPDGLLIPLCSFCCCCFLFVGLFLIALCSACTFLFQVHGAYLSGEATRQIFVFVYFCSQIMQFTCFSRAVESVRRILSTCWCCDPRNEHSVPSRVTTDHLDSEDRKKPLVSARQCHCHIVKKNMWKGMH